MRPPRLAPIPDERPSTTHEGLCSRGRQSDRMQRGNYCAAIAVGPELCDWQHPTALLEEHVDRPTDILDRNHQQERTAEVASTSIGMALCQ